MLRILNCAQIYYIRGGSESYYFALTELLEQKGHQVIPFAAQHPKNFATSWSNYFPVGVNFDSPSPVDLINFLYSISAKKSLKNLLNDYTFDIAHLHIYYGQLTSSILSPLKKASIPIIQTLHEYKIICPVYTLLSQGQICEACQGKYYWKAITKRCNRGSLPRSIFSALEAYVSYFLGTTEKIDHFITVSEFQRQKLIELGVSSDKLTTIYNFIDVSNIPSNVQTGDYLLYFGRLERLKGIFTLLEAAAPLKDIKLLIVGEGSAKGELEREIERRNLAHIRLLPKKDKSELKQLISNSICTILPSEWYENCPMSVLESLAFSKPVIGSAIGGIPELIIDKTDGVLFTSGQVEALREHLIWMNNNRQQAVEMGRLGRQKINSKFNSEVHYNKIMKLYNLVSASI